jgi:hypothetical protein
MGLLTPKGKKGEKRSSNPNSKNNIQGSKFFSNKNVKSTGFAKKGMMTGGSQRGS